MIVTPNYDKARETLNIYCGDCFNRKYNIIVFRYLIFINFQKKKTIEKVAKEKTSKSQKRKDYPSKDEFDQYHCESAKRARGIIKSKIFYHMSK